MNDENDSNPVNDATEMAAGGAAAAGVVRGKRKNRKRRKTNVPQPKNANVPNQTPTPSNPTGWRSRAQQAWHRAKGTIKGATARALDRAKTAGKALISAIPKAKNAWPVIKGRLSGGAAKALSVAAKLPWPPIIKGLIYGGIAVGGAYTVWRLVDKEKNEQSEYSASERRINPLDEDRTNIFTYTSPSYDFRTYQWPEPQSLHLDQRTDQERDRNRQHSHSSQEQNNSQGLGSQGITAEHRPSSQEDFINGMRARASQTSPQTGQMNDLRPRKQNLIDLHSQAVRALAEAVEVMYNREINASNGKVDNTDHVHKMIVGYYETVSYMLQDLFNRAKKATTEKELDAIHREYQRIISRLDYLKNNYAPEKRKNLLLGESQHGGVKGNFFEWASNNERLSRPKVLRERHQQLIRN